MNAVVIAETLRRHLTNIFFLAALSLLGMAGLAASWFGSAGVLWPSLVWLLAVITGAGLIGPEFSRGTLQLIVSRPLSRSRYLLSRVTGVLGVVAIGAATGWIAEVGARLLRGAPLPWRRLLTLPVTLLLEMLLVLALLALFGALTRAWFNAAIFIGLQAALAAAMGILALLRSRPGALGEFLRDNLYLERGVVAVEATLFPERVLFEPQSLLRVAITAAAALTLACLLFRRREVPYGAD